MTKERRLGRGLGSLLGQPTTGSPQESPTAGASAPDKASGGTAEKSGTIQAESPPPVAKVADVAGRETVAGPKGAVDAEPSVGRLVDVGAVRRNPDQPRKTFDSEALEELRASVARHGVLQPITVRRIENGYELVAGERRWRAARAAGLTSIPAIVRDDVDDDVSLELAIVENVQRQDLDALEKARGYRALMDRVGLSHAEVADRVGMSRSAVSNQLRLLDLPPKAQEALAEGMISTGHARALLGIKDEQRLLEALARVVRKGLSVRETEDLTRDGAAPKAQSTGRGKVVQPASPPWVTEMEARLREVLGVRVTLRNGANYKGSIHLDYASRDELERICDSIAPKKTL